MQMLDRKIAPPFVQSVSFDLIKPEKKVLSNGAEIFFIRGGSQDVLKIELIFKAGRWFEQTWGASHFSSHLFSKGTKTKNSFDIARLFDYYGAHLEVSAGLDNISIALYALSKNLKPVLDLLFEILSEPTFPEKEIDQAKSIYIQNLKVNNEKTSYLAGKLFRKNLFGENHPYGKELEEDDINKIEKNNLENHFNGLFRNTSVFVSGKVDKQNETLIENTFSRWRSLSLLNDSPKSISVTPHNERTTKADSVQSSIRMGRKSILRVHPDYVKAVFVSHILGGYFGSRLMKNIREEKGLTYGIHASIHPLQHESYLAIGADVNKENIDLTLEEIRKELKLLRTEKVSESELETTKNHFIGSLQSEITTPFAHADKIKTIYLQGLPFSYYQDMITIINKITPEEIIQTSEVYFHEESLFETAVG
jgi:zinc protease